jgi:uncharacterized protein YeaO (DUF488 family)
VTVRIVRLGSPRVPREGLRIGTVRRPPRGIRKADYAAKDFYDVWLPVLAPSSEAVKHALAARSDREWIRFIARYRREMSATVAGSVLDLLAALSHRTDFSVGCYCGDEARCHRGVLRQLLLERGADVE